MSATFYAQNLKYLRLCEPRADWVDGETAEYRSVYIGSYMTLDPCGRYHHCLSLNGANSRCEAFWEALEKAADRLGGWIESGEGDPTDIYFCLPLEETSDEEE
jgi:hypothetical protein